MNYNKLINNIQSTHNVLQASVSKAINPEKFMIYLPQHQIFLNQQK